MRKLRINPLDLEDLQEIKKYIAKELENPAAAISVVSSIIESYEKLKEFPMLVSFRPRFSPDNCTCQLTSNI